MDAVDVRGRFVWHELMTRDVAGAKTFYSKLVGWKPQPWPLDPSYTICHSGTGPTSGFFEIPPEFPADMPAHWMGYVGTRDVDGTVAAAVKAGASLVKGPDDIKGAGRYAVLKDPQGAVFAILDPENARAESPGVPALGTFSWHELATTDSEAAFSFYSSLFGWDAMYRHDMGPIGIYLVFGSNGVQRGGMWNRTPDMPGPPSWLPYVHVPNVDAGSKTAESSGATTLVPPMEVPGGSRITAFLDPGGAAFAIQSMPPGSAMSPLDQEKPQATAKPKAAVTAKARPKAKTKIKAKAKPAKRKTAKKVSRRNTKVAAKKSRSTKKVSRREPMPVKRRPAKRVARKKKTVRRKK